MATWRSGIALALVVLALTGCMSFSVKTTGADSVDDLNAENAYIALYMDHMATYGSDLKAFQPSGSDPGPCNKGGNAQTCFDVDARVIADLTAMVSALEATNVPPRYVEADRLLRDALAKNIKGLDLRNQAIAQGDNTLWHQHAAVLEEADAAWTAAYAAFPADNKPPLGP